MNKQWKYYLFVLLLLFSSSGLTKEKQYQFRNILIEDSVLVFDFELFGLFSEDVLKGLNKGMTAAIEYRIQLWEERHHWFDRMVIEKTSRMKISYDNWEKGYLLTRPGGTSVLLSEEHLIERCSQHEGFRVIELDQLEGGDCYIIVVKAVLQPMSVDNYEEIKRWLAGEVNELDPKALKSSESPDEKAGDWLLGLVLNLTGFGDRVITAESPTFWLENDTVIIKKED